ncbi:MAG: hypothetical protein KF744_00245 [Taibaiella sp.]|nr:hypothetical protein [Taibaiella sp.]
MNRLIPSTLAFMLSSLFALCQDATVSLAASDETQVVDTVSVFDPVTKMEIQVKTIYVKPPQYLNGQRVYRAGETSKPPKLNKPTKGQSPEKYIMSALIGTFAAFPNGRYRIYANYAVIDRAGKCVQCRVASVKRLGRLYMPTAFMEGELPVDAAGTDTTFYGFRNMGCDTTRLFSDKICSLLGEPHTFIPGRRGHKKVTAAYNLYTERFDVVVKNGTASIELAAPIQDKGGLMQSLENQNKGDWHMIKFSSRATPSSLPKD